MCRPPTTPVIPARGSSLTTARMAPRPKATRAMVTGTLSAATRAPTSRARMSRRRPVSPEFQGLAHARHRASLLLQHKVRRPREPQRKRRRALRLRPTRPASKPQLGQTAHARDINSSRLPSRRAYRRVQKSPQRRLAQRQTGHDSRGPPTSERESRVRRHLRATRPQEGTPPAAHQSRVPGNRGHTTPSWHRSS